MVQASSQVAVVISFELDGVVQSIVLDTIHDVQVNSSSTVNTQPVVSGDLIADHMYRNPRSVSISGDLSLNGSSNPTSWSIKDQDGTTKTYSGILVTGDGVSLANVQSIFERLQTEGIQCDIFKITTHGDQVRFLQRHNMVLQSITWNEKINSMGFNFSFVEAITVEVIQYNVDVSDQFMPNVTEPETSNFTDTLIDWSQVDQSFIRTLFSFDLIKQEFWDYVCSFAVNDLVAIGVAAGTAIALAMICGGLAAIPVIGWVAVAIIGVVVLAVGIFKTVKKLVEQSKYKIKQFKYYKSQKKNQKEAKRFAEVTADVHDELTKLNELIQVYKVASDQPQECMINVDNEYYVFTFTKNNTQDTFDCEITDLNNNKVGGCSNVFAAPTNYNDCASWDPLFNTKNSNYYVYIVNPGEENKLSDCMIVVSKINPKDYDNVLTEVLKKSLIDSGD